VLAVTNCFADAVLLLIGHGSTVNRESAAPLLRHTEELRRRGIFKQVQEAFWKQEPSIRTALASLTADRIYAVPFFLSDGYFTQEIIPRELGLRRPDQPGFARRGRSGEQEIIYCEPVGTDERMVEIVQARAREVVERFPFPRSPTPKETALFLAGHGTERNENSRNLVEDLAARIRSTQLYSAVHAVFLAEEPRVSGCYEMARGKNIVVVPCLMSDGLHTNEDIPILLGESERIVRERLSAGQPTWRNPTEKGGKRVWCSRALGSEPRLAEVIVERVKQAAERLLISPAR
jgi:sirohydrochlorin cobaltochelatase